MDEVLLGLYGFTGGVIIERNGKFEVGEDDMMNSSEKAVLESLLSLGKRKVINIFVVKCINSILFLQDGIINFCTSM